MYLRVVCPICREIHYITLNFSSLSSGFLSQELICPHTNQRYLIEMSIKVKVAPSFSKEELRIAEAEAKERERRWLAEEEYYREKESLEE